MHIHLDAVGGIAGDMFVAAVLDAFPHLEPSVLAAVAATAPVTCALLAHNDGVLQGRRFIVEPTAAAGSEPARAEAPRDHAGKGHVHEGSSREGRAHAGHHHEGHLHESHTHGAGDSEGHHDTGRGQGAEAHAHRHWREIRHALAHAALSSDARDCAIAIFTRLAEAEARVHGIETDEVAFHEVGAWDSIADVVAAGSLIAALGADTTWSCGPLPLGSGRVRTAHGLLPIPAPATALLLEGLPMVDDGIGGERVTPTGAAILAHLHKDGRVVDANREPNVLRQSGVGFGTRRLPGVSNCLRVLVFDRDATKRTEAAHRELLVIEFEVDDQSAEDLAMGLDRLRAHGDVFDVVQMPVFGKKGRMMTAVRALARSSARDEVVAACFRETTTIGLRHHLVSGSALPRREHTVAVGDRAVRVKTVARPGGATAKAEADDALAHETHAARATLRREAERLALQSDGKP